MRRKKLWTKLFKTFREVVEYVEKVKDINGNKVQIEIFEDADLGWFVDVWQVR